MDQLILEQQMLDDGAARYLKAQEKSLKRQELTAPQNRLFTKAIPKVQESLETALRDSLGTTGRPPYWKGPAEALGPLKTAAITLRVAFCRVTASPSYVALCQHIGRHIEVEMIAQAVEEQNETIYKKLTKRVKSLPGQEFKGKVFTELAAEEGFWNPLSDDDRVKIGAGLFNHVLSSTDIFCTYLDNKGFKDQVLGVSFTTAASEQLAEIEGVEAWMRPVYRPMLTPPAPWDDAFTGCYQDPRLAKTFKLVKTDNREHLRAVNQAVKESKPFAQALNIIQAVPLRINKFVLEWVEKAYHGDYPIESLPQKGTVVIPKDAPRWQKTELKRRQTELKSDQVMFLKDLTEAKEYAEYGKFHAPAQLDWRGRVYAKPHLNHQREDHCKALFEFSNGKPIGLQGALWLAIHLATSGGFEKVDKAPLLDRYQWTRDNSDRIVAIAKDPASDLWWCEADSPFVFLASCRAWADYEEQGEGYTCHLPVHVDGSCSGLQHWGAAMRCSTTAKAVNLLPQDVPSDVYSQVADIVKKHIQSDLENPLALAWINYGITRKVAKRCVMTYVYGSKQFGFSEHLYEDFMKPLSNDVEAQKIDQHPFGEDKGKKASQYMAGLIWTAVRDVVKSAAVGMEWLQEVAGLLASENKPVHWVTPMGFPVSNGYFNQQVEKIDLFLFDRVLKVPKRVQPRVMVGSTDELNKRKQRSSISPNFIHSLDGAALQSSVIKAHSEGITDLLLIHDSFGCLPVDMPRYVQIVRETFVDMYTQFDPLQAIYDTAFADLSDKSKAKLPKPPERGDFDISLVLESHYAFA